MPHPPTITAEFRQWQLDDERGKIIGKIYEDKDGMADGTDTEIGFKYITDYPEELLARSVAGRYYKLVKSEAKDHNKWTK